MRSSFLRRKSEEEGGALVEFALTAPLLLIFTLTMFDIVGLLFHYSFLSYLAREGARIGASAPSSTLYSSVNDEVTQHVRNLFRAGTQNGVYRFNAVNPTVVTVLTGNNIHVSVAARFQGFSPVSPVFSFTGGKNGTLLRAEAEGPRI